MTYRRYVAIGDSTTEGLEDAYPPHADLYADNGHTLSPSHPSERGSYRGWADRLAVHLAQAQDAPLDYANLAIRGNKLADVRTQLPVALEMQPDVMSIVAGVNDASGFSWNKHAARGHVAYLFRKARESGADVVTFTMPDPSAVNWLVRPLRRNVFELNDITRTEAKRYGVRVLDLPRYDVSVDARLWHADRLHATSQGHAIIARGLAFALSVPGFDESFSENLPSSAPVGIRQRLREDRTWLREFLLPHAKRHRQGISMGDGRTPKRPIPLPVGPEMIAD
ncbi:SGNH/GDSL hydrolase family protein [Cumulibacter soli]|uniref:SGNH/GDSL hydrolase family protein n=1 Tax=Cumulibacter soli TaxID=2546344 RepID=UPI001067F96C|nr:SGNH/GDSL hydrolase family protein [Cumulibacter soli]